MLFLNIKNELKVGDRSVEVAQLQHYFEILGYLLPIAQEKDRTYFDENLERAIAHFQRVYGLSENGRIDLQTIELIATPRCGVADQPGLTQETYSNPICGWRKRTLTYHIAETLAAIGENNHRQTFYANLQKCANATGITFIPRGLGSHIQSFTYRGDGPGSTFAYAFYPCDPPSSGNTYYDLLDVWSVNTPTPRNKVDFVSVCLHELGHALGLGHSASRSAVMYAYSAFGEMRREFTSDDLRGLRSLYPRLTEEETTSQDEVEPIIIPAQDPKLV